MKIFAAILGLAALAVVNAQPNPEACMMCPMALDILKGMLESNPSIQHNIKQTAVTLCGDLPLTSQMNAQCVSLLEKLLPTIFKDLLNDVPVNEICKSFGCKNNLFKMASKNPQACAMCQKVEGMLVNYVKDNEQQFLTEMSKMCAILGPLSPECDTVINKYGKTFLNMLLQKLQSGNICSQLKFCGASFRSLSGMSECDLCKSVAGELDTLLTQYSGVIIKEMSMVCNYMGAMKAECVKLVDGYGPAFVDALKAQLMPNKLCPELHACPVTRSQLAVQATSQQCAACEKIAAYVVQYIKSQESNILSQAKTMCNQLGFLAGECDSLVQQYGSAVVNAIANALQASKICPKIGSCSSSLIVNQASSSGECSACQTAAGEIQALLKQYGPTIISEAEMVCNYMGGFASECRTLLGNYLPKLLAMLESDLAPNMICKEIGMCPKASPKQLIAMPPAKATNTMCSICDLIVTRLDQLIMGSEQSILSALEGVCSKLGFFAKECDTLVAQYGPTLLNALTKDLTPAKLCSKFCSGSPQPFPSGTAGCNKCQGIVKSVEADIPATEEILKLGSLYVCTVLGFPWNECERLNSQYLPKLINIIKSKLDGICTDIDLCIAPAKPKMTKLLVQPAAASNTMCSTCTMIVTRVDQLIMGSEQSILSALEGVCSKLGFFAKECDALVAQYGPALLNALTKDLTPAKLCSKFCTGTPQAVPSGTAGCTKCQAIVQEVESEIKSHEATLESLADGVCAQLGFLKNECDNLIKQYLPTLINAALSKLGSVCSDIHMCQAKPKMTKLLVQPVAATNTMCSTCDMIVTRVDQLIMGSEQSILSALEGVCSKLGFFAKECDALVAQYGPALLNALTKDLTPAKLCSKFCSGKPQVVASGSAGCSKCQAIVQEVESEIKSHEATLESLADGICAQLGFLKNECDNLIKQYLPTLINAALSKLGSVCTDIHMCSAAPQKLAQRSGSQCAVCEQVAQQMVNYVKNNEQQLINDAKTVCTQLGLFAGACDMIIDKFAPSLITALINDLKPAALCADVKMCPSGKPMFNHKSQTTCELCDYAANALDNYIKSNSQMLIQDLEKVCNDLGALKPECQALIKQYGGMLITDLENALMPSKLCPELKLCP